MRYECIECNYSTDNNSNWHKHIKTKIHLKKVRNTDIDKPQTNSKPSINREPPENEPSVNRESFLHNQLSQNDESNESKLICKNCNVNFTTKQALCRHVKHRCPKNNTDNEKSKDEQIAELKKDKAYLQSQLEKSIQTSNNSAIVSKKLVSALTYIKTTYTDAPVLQSMKNYPIIKNPNLADIMINYYRDDMLIQFLGNLFVDYYRKGKPEEQSFWNSDCSRLNYIIRTLVEDEPDWIADKEGIKLKACIITPLLLLIRKELIAYMIDPVNMAKYSHRVTLCCQLITDIDNSTIADDLIKYLAPRFQLIHKKEISVLCLEKK